MDFFHFFFIVVTNRFHELSKKLMKNDYRFAHIPMDLAAHNNL